jgi:hypothetical protein
MHQQWPHGDDPSPSDRALERMKVHGELMEFWIGQDPHGVGARQDSERPVLG